MIKLVNLNDKDKASIEKIYHEAFPSSERFPFDYLTAHMEDACFEVIKDDDDIVGFAYDLMDDEVIHIFFLAIAKDQRSKGYGTKFFDLLKQKYPNRKLFLALETIDPEAPNYLQRCKRVDFYKNQGFKYADFSILEKGLVYDVMSIGDVFAADYHRLIDKWCGDDQKLFKMGTQSKAV